MLPDIGLCVIFRLVSLKFAVLVTGVLSPTGYFKLKICIATQWRQVISLLHNESPQTTFCHYVSQSARKIYFKPKKLHLHIWPQQAT
jgi:hypothetical protein